MTDKPEEKKVATAEPVEVLPMIELTIGDDANLPATVDSAQAPVTATGGLSYATARPDEKERMDAIIAGIDLTDPETVVSIGAQEREQLASLADQLLDSFKPDVKLAFAEALKAVIDSVKENSLDNIKNRSTMGALKKLFKVVACVLTGKDYRIELNKDLVKNFMEDITGSRKIIQETTDKLIEQKGELSKNFDRINGLGAAIVRAAQDMRIVRAATAEYIRRVEAGDITTLSDLEAEAQASGRADDAEKLQLAHATYNNLRVVDGDLLGSIAVYDMNVANLAFTKQANIQNRMQTSTALTTTIAEWKTQLAVFGTVLVERTAQQVLGTVKDLTEKSGKANRDLFEELVDMTIARSTQGTYSLRSLANDQASMAAKLQTIGPAVEKQFNELAADKQALEESITKFRQTAGKVYSNKKGVLSAPGMAP